MKRAGSLLRRTAARAVLVALAVLLLAPRASNAADLDGEIEREQSIAVAGGVVALTLATNAELQTRWGPVVALGVGERRGPALNAYVGDSVRLGPRWSLRPGFRFVRSWQAVADCPTGCTFDLYIGEIGIRYRGPSGFLFEYGLPLFGWLPVGPSAGETHPHLSFYTLATGEMAFASTLLAGFTFDL
jgi:hypothetical protein